MHEVNHLNIKVIAERYNSFIASVRKENVSPELQPQVSIVMSYMMLSTEVKNSCKSILSQTYQNMEFLIIDDVNSGTVCKYLSRLEDRQESIKIIKNLKIRG